MRRKQSIDQGRVDCRRYQLLRNSCVSFIGKIWHTAIGTAAERYLCHNGKLCYCLAVSQTQKKETVMKLTSVDPRTRTSSVWDLEERFLVRGKRPLSLPFAWTACGPRVPVAFSAPSRRSEGRSATEGILGTPSCRRLELRGWGWRAGGHRAGSALGASYCSPVTPPKGIHHRLIPIC